MIANERAYEETSKFKILAFSEQPLVDMKETLNTPQ
jgi:hypothetical protein